MEPIFNKVLPLLFFVVLFFISFLVILIIEKKEKHKEKNRIISVIISTIILLIALIYPLFFESFYKFFAVIPLISFLLIISFENRLMRFSERIYKKFIKKVPKRNMIKII